ncbi:MAG: glycerol-3-phosphate 1-O-acyltransferase PlsY [Clostridiales bacterium]|nr:glycerol-3-phosphate 1-O-acyltransferase PlsY [Clostridiales bacterium]
MESIKEITLIIKEVLFKGLLGIHLEKTPYSSQVFDFIFISGYILCIVIPYLLGSFNFAIVISKWKYKDDIRNHGSKNGGMTNMLRTYGRGAAAATLIGDTLKAIVAVIFGYLVFGKNTAYVAGLFCIIGHVFPIYFNFQGGKGVVTAATMVLLLNPLVFFILFIMFVLLVASTKFISLGSIICIMVYPILLNRIDGPDFSNIIAIFIMILVVFLHRGNIKRLLAGTESKVSFKKK